MIINEFICDLCSRKLPFTECCLYTNDTLSIECSCGNKMMLEIDNTDRKVIFVNGSMKLV